MTKQQVKDNIDQDIALKSTANSISPTNVGKNMKDIVDLISDFNSISLPTPQISKKKVFINDGKDLKTNIRHKFDTISNLNYTIENLKTLNYPQDYYKERFDIYFNLFAENKNYDWLSLPDKKLELCIVSNNGSKEGNNSILKGNKDKFTNAIIHPSNYTKSGGFTEGGTIYSGGGSQSGFKTEWLIDLPDANNLSSESFYSTGLNKLNNPNITVELDIRDFFPNLNYPHQFFDGKSKDNISVRKIGIIEYNLKKGKVYKRNAVIFFRLSAGIIGTEKIVNGVTKYKKRIFSDLSQPIYICPKIKNFFNVLNDFDRGLYPFMYGHTSKIGSK